MKKTKIQDLNHKRVKNVTLLHSQFVSSRKSRKSKRLRSSLKGWGADWPNSGSGFSRARLQAPQGGAMWHAPGTCSSKVCRSCDCAELSVKSINNISCWGRWRLPGWSTDIALKPLLDAALLNLADPAKISTKIIWSVDASMIPSDPSFAPPWIRLGCTELSGDTSCLLFSQSCVHSMYGLCLKHLSLKHTWKPRSHRLPAAARLQRPQL